MGHEIDFLAIGEKSNSGDAICLRYGSDQNGFIAHIVDGGFRDCGDKIIGHIITHYGKLTHIDHVVLTHADNDHAGGLIRVLDYFSVGTLWMNRPWIFAHEIKDLFKYGWTSEGLEKKLRELYPTLVELEELAAASKVPISDVFQGAAIGDFRVLAPSRERYLSLIPQFDKTPQAKFHEPRTLLGGLLASAAKLIKETWTGETLSENPEPTSASNESSVVQIGFLDGKRILLTGDVGPMGLIEAFNYASANGLGPPNLAVVQVPHHGSRRNVTPTALNAWLGLPLAVQGGPTRGSAFCSAAKNDEDHPRKKVINAFIRRGYPVHVTKGMAKYHYYQLPLRSGWADSIAQPFSTEVEE
jgi:hypothetical protein